MKNKTVVVLLSSAFALLLFAGQAFAQQYPSCIPTQDQAGQALAGRGRAGGGGQGRGPAEHFPRSVEITAIPGVVDAGVQWTKIWQEAGNSADGILATKDGSVLVAQEDYDTVLKISPTGETSVLVKDAKGIGSLSMDRQGNLYGAHRTERPGSTKPDKDTIENAITVLWPKRKMVADKWMDGTTLSVRPNDLLADSHGGAYFTVGCLYYASPKDGVTVMADNLRTNGIAFSPDDKILYVTNGGSLVAFDVEGPGKLTNRRDFAKLMEGTGGDGTAVDTEGRLYVSSGPGVQVIDKTGKYLGLIPTPRGVISVAFAGPGKKTLFIAGGGAEDDNGNPIRQGPQQTAATVYKLPVLSQGLKDRSK